MSLPPFPPLKRGTKIIVKKQNKLIPQSFHFQSQQPAIEYYQKEKHSELVCFKVRIVQFIQIFINLLYYIILQSVQVIKWVHFNQEYCP